jgi:acyl carrier protein
MADHASLRENLKRLIVESLRLDGLTTDRIADDTPLFDGELGLDSVDALELVVAVEKEYGIKIKSHEMDKDVLASVASLGNFVARTLDGAPGGPKLDGN